MKLTRTHKDPVAMRASGTVVHDGESIEVDDRAAELLLAQGGWEKAAANDGAKPVTKKGGE